jgi:hypothetical protein
MEKYPMPPTFVSLYLGHVSVSDAQVIIVLCYMFKGSFEPELTILQFD